MGDGSFQIGFGEGCAIVQKQNNSKCNLLFASSTFYAWNEIGGISDDIERGRMPISVIPLLFK